MFVRSSLLLALALLTAACGGKGDGGGATLRVDVVGDITDEAAAPRRTIAQLTQQGLVTLDAAGQVVPGLATSWRIADDGLSVIFRLRPAAWPDGRKVTANDVVAAFRRAMSPAARNPLRAYLAGVTVGAPVENVVEVRTAGAMPELLQLLAQPAMAITRAGPRPLPIGAFALRDAAIRPIMLARNPSYHAADTVALDAVALMPADDPGAAIARFARDRSDLVISPGLAGFGDARLLSASLRVEPTWSVYGYAANVAHGPLADPRVRRALAMAIDRDDLGSRLFGVALTPVLGLVPPIPGEPVPALPDWAIKAPAERLALARDLLAKAGYSEAKPLRLTISLPEGREHESVAAEIGADWTRIGVGVRSVTRTPAAHAVIVARGGFDLALVELSTPIETPLPFLLRFGCAARTGGYCNPAADALVATARTNPDPVMRAATLAQAEATIVADTPFIPLFVPVRWSLVSRRVAGWTDNAAGQHPLDRLTVIGKPAAR